MRLALVRHLTAIAALPFVVTVAVPVMIARRSGIGLGPARMTAASVIAGAVLLGIGLVLFVWSLRQFHRHGDGTLAPWDPPRRLVVAGPYRFVRNPMISGVIIALVGESALWHSVPHLAWAAAFALLNLVVIPVFEEPMLRARFGADYDEYRRHVPALVPRLTAWTPS